MFYKDTKILKLAMPVSDKATGDIYDFAVKLMVRGGAMRVYGNRWCLGRAVPCAL